VLDAPAANGHDLVAVDGAQALSERCYDIGGAGAGGDEEDAVERVRYGWSLSKLEEGGCRYPVCGMMPVYVVGFNDGQSIMCAKME
jgi:hypothetical protein